jgi:hypothetical protein
VKNPELAGVFWLIWAKAAIGAAAKAKTARVFTKVVLIFIFFALLFLSTFFKVILIRFFIGFKMCSVYKPEP